MTLFWVLVGVGTAWLAIGSFFTFRLDVGIRFFAALGGVMMMTLVIAMAAYGTWYRLHPDPAWGRCIKIELRNAPTLVNGKTQSKPEWVCTLWG